MISEFANRQNMSLAVQHLLSSTEFKPVLVDQQPVAFTALVVQLAVKVNELAVLSASQYATNTCIADDKARQEQELESITHEISQALVVLALGPQKWKIEFVLGFTRWTLSSACNPALFW
jgi:hypothetical protein